MLVKAFGKQDEDLHHSNCASAVKVRDHLVFGGIPYAKNSPVKKKRGRFYVAAALEAAVEDQGPGTRRKKRRTTSPKARARISAAQKARWAKRKRA
jgi:hypothetical protein